MDKLAGVSAAALRAALADASGAKSALRLVVALDYKAGIPVRTMGDRYGIPRSTLYAWLDRFEEAGIEAAISDERRPGRPKALDEEERAEIRRTMANSPGGRDSWTPASLREHIEEEYGVRYSLGHVRRLLRADEI